MAARPNRPKIWRFHPSKRSASRSKFSPEVPGTVATKRAPIQYKSPRAAIVPVSVAAGWLHSTAETEAGFASTSATRASVTVTTAEKSASGRSNAGARACCQTNGPNARRRRILPRRESRPPVRTMKRFVDRTRRSRGRADLQGAGRSPCRRTTRMRPGRFDPALRSQRVKTDRYLIPEAARNDDNHQVYGVRKSLATRGASESTLRAVRSG